MAGGNTKQANALFSLWSLEKIWIIRKAKKELIKALKRLKQFVNKNNIN